MIKTKKTMKKVNNQLNLLTKYTSSLYKTIQLIKMSMKVFVVILLDMLMKQKMNLFYK